MNNISYGALGERIASEYLIKNGFKILAKNCKFYNCELDIVANFSKRAQKKKIKNKYKNGEIKSKSAYKFLTQNLSDLLVFVEVKYSSTLAFGEPMERVDVRKQNQLKKAAEGFIIRNHYKGQCRFDVISIVGNDIKHIENAFEI